MLRLRFLERFLKSSALLPGSRSGCIISWDSQDRFVPVFLRADQADGAVLTASGSCRPCQGPRQRAPRSCFKPLAHQLALGAPTGARQRPGWPCHQFPARPLQPPSLEELCRKREVRKRNLFRNSVVILVSCNGKPVRDFRLKNSVEGGTFLLVLWVRIHLATQGIRVRFLVGELGPHRARCN